MSVYPSSYSYDAEGNARIGGIDVSQLATDFGTPLYILDQHTIHDHCQHYLTNLSANYPDFKVLYAGKANLSVGLAQLLHKEGLCFDVSSGGELYTVLAADIDPKHIYFHGNNKSQSELELAIEKQVTIIVDNDHELRLIQTLIQGRSLSQPLRLMVRMKPEIEAHTHDYIKTGQLDSKFGIHKDDLLPIVQSIHSHEQLQFVGIHSHIGSQIFDTTPYETLIDILMETVLMLHRHDIPVHELNIGGGVGVQYTDSDTPPDMTTFITRISQLVQQQFKANTLPLPTLLFEPGRSIIATAGITVYTIGAIKAIKDLKTYLFVDGGMADNPRPMMYQSKHIFELATQSHKPAVSYSIAGKFCESGDILAEDVLLPPVRLMIS